MNFAWIFFRLEDFKESTIVIKKIFTIPGKLFYDSNTLLMGLIAVVIVLFHEFFKEKQLEIHFLNSHNKIIGFLAVVLIIVYILAFGVINGGSFIYFQF